MRTHDSVRPGNLEGVRVVEIADQQAEYAGLLLAGMGAEVIKVEPPGGSATRRIGPFYQDRPHPERSLYFWQYNRGKRSVALELPDQRDVLIDLIASADVLLDSTPLGYLQDMRIEAQGLGSRFPHLIRARVTPFGDTGPWAGYAASDLIHLALGGVMMNCGYDPEPDGSYDLPPIAPQMWHAYHIAGEQLVMGVLGALLHRQETGFGQSVGLAVHEAVAKCTEIDLMSWVMRRTPVHRQTCRHAAERVSAEQAIGASKDGRWTITRGPARPDNVDGLVDFLQSFGIVEDPEEAGLARGGEAPAGSRSIPGTSGSSERSAREAELMQRLVKKFTHDRVPWAQAQEHGLLWAPLRKPHENAEDQHWWARGTFAEISHPEIGRSVTYAVSRWCSEEAPWQVGGPAPAIGQHDDQIDAMLARRPSVTQVVRGSRVAESQRNKAFALQDVRILDFTWFLASGGATRFLAAFGADTIKVEWRDNPDTRFGAMAPEGGRTARERATGPLPPVSGLNMGGQFNNKHAGKRGISLNVRHPRGLEIAKRLVSHCDIVAEGFSPGVMERWGLGYDVLREIKPDIIYCQQSGMGTAGTYGSVRTVGPVAAAFAGASEMSGLPEPAMPAGWGYSYLDWVGAYSFANAMLAALHHRHATGRGQQIDASQTEAGIFINGTSVADWSVNGREWTRYGNRSPYLPAAPHGAYRCTGEDRWVAIACFTEEHWRALVKVMGEPAWAANERFWSLDSRLRLQDELDGEVSAWTARHDRYDVMEWLQAAGVPAGVCQTAEDRCDRDPQLDALGWMTEVTGTDIGRWPVPEVPAKLSETPAYIGGLPDRGAPCYGEDNDEVLHGLLGFTEAEIADLRSDGVI